MYREEFCVHPLLLYRQRKNTRKETYLLFQYRVEPQS